MLAKWASPELISRPQFTDLDMQIGSTHTGLLMVIMVGMTLVMFQNIFSHLCLFHTQVKTENQALIVLDFKRSVMKWWPREVTWPQRWQL